MGIDLNILQKIKLYFKQLLTTALHPDFGNKTSVKHRIFLNRANAYGCEETLCNMFNVMGVNAISSSFKRNYLIVNEIRAVFMI